MSNQGAIRPTSRVAARGCRELASSSVVIRGEGDYNKHCQTAFRKLQIPIATRQTPPFVSSLASPPSLRLAPHNRRWFASTAAATPKAAKAADNDKNDGAITKSKKKKKKPNKRILLLRKRYKRRHQQTNGKQRKGGDSDRALPSQLREFYNEIAPLVPIKTLESFVALLESKRTAQQRKKLVEQSAKLSHIEESNHENPQDKNNDDSTPDPQNWMQLKVLSFLDVLPLHVRPVKTMISPEELNLKTYRKTAYILKLARDKSVLENNMSWSETIDETSPKHVYAERRQAYHQAKSEQEAHKEAREFARVLAQRLPSAQYNSLVRLFESYAQQDEEKKNQESSAAKSFLVKPLFNVVNTEVGANVHLVAPELAQFFYFDPPTNAATASDKEEGDNKSLEDNDSSAEQKISGSLALKEPKVIESEKAWQESKQHFVGKMLELYQRIHGPSTLDADSDTEMAPPIDEDAEERLVEIVTANLQNESSTSEQNKKKLGKPKSGKKGQVHLIFDAVAVNAYRDRDDKEYALSSDTTVFIDNLPIDATEDELMELYSRCGALESVEIFNQRPDLDPGPLSPTELRRMGMKKHKQGRRRDSLSQKAGGWARPRTPVYAMLSFDEEAAATAASQDALRIFGMIVRGHSIRSFRAKELTRLYIDNIATAKDGRYRSAIDIEFSLSQLLNPDLYVSLGISSGSHKQSKKVAPGSCEIMFPSFEVAHDAFCKLRVDLDLVKDDESCTINWLKTPPDALQYWTRELGGVV